MPRPLTRNLDRVVEGRRGTKVVVTLTQEGIVLREFGRRKRFGPLDYGALLISAVRQDVDAKKRERKARRGKK